MQVPPVSPPGPLPAVAAPAATPGRASALPRPRWGSKAVLLALLLVISLLTAACGSEAARLAEPSAPPQAATQTTSGDQDGTAQTPPAPDRLIIRDGTINLTVASVNDSLAAVRAIAAQAEGLV